MFVLFEDIECIFPTSVLNSDDPTSANINTNGEQYIPSLLLKRMGLFKVERQKSTRKGAVNKTVGWRTLLSRATTVG